VTTIISNLESIALNCLYEMQIFVASDST
jgi:hypothetical protein